MTRMTHRLENARNTERFQGILERHIPPRSQVRPPDDDRACRRAGSALGHPMRGSEGRSSPSAPCSFSSYVKRSAADASSDAGISLEAGISQAPWCEYIPCGRKDVD